MRIHTSGMVVVDNTRKKVPTPSIAAESIGFGNDITASTSNQDLTKRSEESGRFCVGGEGLHDSKPPTHHVQKPKQFRVSSSVHDGNQNAPHQKWECSSIDESISIKTFNEMVDTVRMQQGLHLETPIPYVHRESARKIELELDDHCSNDSTAGRSTQSNIEAVTSTSRGSKGRKRRFSSCERFRLSRRRLFDMPLFVDAMHGRSRSISVPPDFESDGDWRVETDKPQNMPARTLD